MSQRRVHVYALLLDTDYSHTGEAILPTPYTQLMTNGRCIILLYTSNAFPVMHSVYCIAINQTRAKYTKRLQQE